MLNILPVKFREEVVFRIPALRNSMLDASVQQQTVALTMSRSTAVVTVAATGEALTLGVAACRRRLQRVRGDEDEQDEVAQESASATPTRQLDFTGTATGSRAATERRRQQCPQ